MRQYSIIGIPFLIGFGCIIAYNLIGSYVREDGLLIEPFALIPIAWLMFSISFCAGIFFAIRTLFKKSVH